MDWETMRRATDWTIQTVQEYGPERARQLIEAYQQSGYLSGKVSVALQGVAAAIQPEAAPPEDQNGPEKMAAERAEAIAALDTAQKRHIIRRIINRLQKSGARQDTSHG
jgi:hypothetical protein